MCCDKSGEINIHNVHNALSILWGVQMIHRALCIISIKNMHALISSFFPWWGVGGGGLGLGVGVNKRNHNLISHAQLVLSLQNQQRTGVKSCNTEQTSYWNSSKRYSLVQCNNNELTALSSLLTTNCYSSSWKKKTSTFCSGVMNWFGSVRFCRCSSFLKANQEV